MPEPKTKATDASVEDYLAARATPEQATDCTQLIALMCRLTGEPPRMWGPSIVGFGSYRYPLSGGKQGESCATGFAVRGKDLVVYLIAESQDQASLLARLGKHRIGKACLYFKRLADLDEAVLEHLVAASLAELRRRYG